MLELASINSHIKAVRSRYGTQYQTYLDISDHAGSNLSLIIHYYKNEAMLAQILLSIASQKQLGLDGDTKKTLQEIAGSAHSSAFKPVIESDRMMMRQLKQVLIIAAIVIPPLTAYAIYTVKHSQAKSKSNSTAASQVAVEYLHNLSAGDTNGALELESPNLQSDSDQTQYLRTSSFNGFDTSKRIDQYSGRDRHGDYMSYVYRYDGGQKPYYIKIALSE
ncbi:MAG TPA: hypothetical protein VIJ25_19235, partial [Methylococcales bacterium]